MSDTPDTPETPGDVDPAADTPTAEAAEGAEEEVEAPEPDPIRDPLVEQLRGALGDAVVGSVVQKGDVWIRVERGSWRATAQYLKDHGFTYFCFLSGIDWQPSAELSNRYEQVFTGEAPADDAANGPTDSSVEQNGAAQSGLDTGLTGGDSRFQVFARFYDVERKLGITVKADLDGANPTVDSLVPVFRGADWHERETWEMFGFDFVGHPGLRHLYLPTEFEGFPLRKDFPLLARVVKPWPGLVDKEPVPGEDEEEEAAAT